MVVTIKKVHAISLLFPWTIYEQSFKSMIPNFLKLAWPTFEAFFNLHFKSFLGQLVESIKTFLKYDNMHFNTFISYILYIYSNEHEHKCMLSRFNMIKRIISMFSRIFLIFHNLMTFDKNFMTLIYQ